tara:strand:+ start:750 stop:1331 length:582 start_codon:yes stop_codon:yes gene_type:complete
MSGGMGGGEAGIDPPTTTKGDISGFDTTFDRIPIGANTQVLTADSTEALGLKWATPATGVSLADNNTWTGIQTFNQAIDVSGNNVDNIQNLIHDISTSGTDIDFSEDQLQTYGGVGVNTTFTTSNRATGKSKTLRMYASGADRDVTFPAGIRWLGTQPIANVFTLTQSKYAIFTFTCFTTAESEIIGAFALEE